VIYSAITELTLGGFHSHYYIENSSLFFYFPEALFCTVKACFQIKGVAERNNNVIFI